MKSGYLLSLGCFLFSPLLHAYDQLPGDNFFNINEKSRPVVLATDLSPLNTLNTLKGAAGDVNLLSLVRHNSTPPRPPEKYVRRAHFGSWLDFPRDNTCFNARGLVLVRDSRAQFAVNPLDPCYIKTGLWFDPYNNMNFTEANRVQIDHVVPVKDAYIAGAYQWPWKMRCAYFNFLGNSYHLMPVENSTNRSKSDRGPERWMPPNRKYHCQYLANWLRIKAIWKLMLSAQEAYAIKQMTQDLQCDPSTFKMTGVELKKQRAIIGQIADECPEAPYFTLPLHQMVK